jgi:peptide/nickel transport system substrate-binding protein
MNDKSNDVRWLSRRNLLRSAGGATAVALAGCGGDGGDGDGDGGTAADGDGGSDGDGGDGMSGGKLTFAQAKSPIEFDPVVLNDVPSGEIADRIFESLYAWDESTGHVPRLAAGMPEITREGTRYVVELNGDATFQNGDPVTAGDVAYSFLAPADEETENASEVVMIDSAEAVDDQTVQFDLAYPFGPFLNTLHRNVVPKSVRENDKAAFKTEQPIGSGAFKFENWTEGESTTISRYEDYWGEELPNLAEVEFVPVKEATTRVTTLRNDENDVIKSVPPQSWQTVEGMDNAAVDAVPGIGYFYLAFNCKEGPTADRRVREAVDYCFSMDQAVQNFVEPTGVRQYSPYPRSVAEDWDFPLDEWEQVPHDKDIGAAETLFEEAGVPSDYSWRIIVPPDNKREQLGISVSNGLQEAGYEAQVQRLDWGAFLEQYVSGSEDDYNMYTLGWSGLPDPDSFTYYLLARTDDVLGVTNGTYWGENSEAGVNVAEQFVEARETPNKEERRQLYVDATTTMLEERPHIPSYNLKESFGVNDYVEDFTAHTVASFRLLSDQNNVSVS